MPLGGLEGIPGSSPWERGPEEDAAGTMSLSWPGTSQPNKAEQNGWVESARPNVVRRTRKRPNSANYPACPDSLCGHFLV